MIDRCLKPTKSISFQCRLEKSLRDNSTLSSQQKVPTLRQLLKTRISHIDIMPPAQQIKQQQQQMPALDEAHGFLANHETVYFNTNISTEEFNSIIATHEPHATLSLNWSAVIENQGKTRIACGQHFTQLHAIYETAICPPNEGQEREASRRRRTLDVVPEKREFAFCFNSEDASLTPLVHLKTEAVFMTRKGEESDDDDDDEFWEPNEHYIGKRCLLEDETFVLAARA